jgi:hypothetical protein|tara:strand:- start:158 stop:325 length:168 start_codon:yes stop_codon:yes gene_type:complete
MGMNSDPEVGNEEPVAAPDAAPAPEGTVPRSADQADRLRGMMLANQHSNGRPFGK